MPWFEENNGSLTVCLRVIPRASKNIVQGLHGDALKIRLQAPPVEGKANQALIRFIAKEWGIPKSSITILSGETGRNKRIRIHPAPDRLQQELKTISDGCGSKSV